MTTDELRKLYLDFFKSKDHKVFSSDSLVPADDPSLLFTGAGMNQFKPYFLGLKKDLKRATSCQKCLRTGDLENVGRTAYHHTFFEMLGNFSFGDYFKEQAIEWGWEFVTKGLALPADNLWVSVYQSDDEAFEIWKQKIGLPESRIVRMSAVDNFWPSNAQEDGPNGPCGPCSEIYVGKVPGKGVEIWNLVFTQFDRQSDKTLKPLPQKNIDTGMGLERAASVIQGVESNYDIDTFQKIRKELKAFLPQGGDRAHENAVMDHLRAVSFSIADGALPSNEGRGYVIRKLIRIASDRFKKAGAKEEGSLYKLVPAIIGVMGGVYPELKDREKNIISVVQNEEKNYLDVLKVQVPKLEEGLKTIKGSSRPDEDTASLAFKFYDTYGVPQDMIEDIIERAGIKLNRSVFEKLLEEQRERSRQTSKISEEIFANKEIYTLIQGLKDTSFVGYDTETVDAKLLRIAKSGKIAESLEAGEEGLFFFDRTPFYAESGGQVGDKGVIEGTGFKAEVLDTQYVDKCVAHKVKVISGKAKPETTYTLAVDSERRADIMKNHTATHLLHSALRKVLGDHVKQSGSLVAPDYLRFDFTNFGVVPKEKLAEIETLVNGEIKKSTKLNKKVMPKEEALKEGAIAFFGEKYGDSVRIIGIGDFSKEFCGGTHLENTGQIGSFKITSEGSVQAGVRRIEAVTGRHATKLSEEAGREWEALLKEFGIKEGGDVKQSLTQFRQKTEALKTQSLKAVLDKMTPLYEKEIQRSTAINGVRVLVRKEKNATADLFMKMYERLNATGSSFVLLLQCQAGDKITLAAASSKDAVSRGFQSGKVIKLVSAIVEGNGGGRPEFAVGGGKNLSKVDEALAKGLELIQEELKNLK